MAKEEVRDTRALVRVQQSGPPMVVAHGEVWDDSEPRVLLAGPDTIYFSFDSEITDEMWAHLDWEQRKAKEVYEERQAEYAPDWLGGVMATTGARGGYHFRVETADFTVKLLKGVQNRPPIFVEMRAMGLHLHSRGAQGACEDACAYVRDVLLNDWSRDQAQEHITLDTAKCSRMDLHCDWQGGWYPTLTEGETRQFLRPGRCDWHPYLSGNTCTGYRFGTGHVQARIYNKTLDVAKKHLDWYPELLRQRNGLAYNPALPVWRLEFQLMRDGVKGFKLYSKPEVTDEDDEIMAELEREDLPHVGSVRKALHWSGTMFDYLTRRWLRLTEPNGDKNRARWPTHPTWEVLQTGYAQAMAGAPLAESKLELVRKQRHTGYERFLHRIEVGVGAMMDAMQTDAVEIAASWFAHLHRLLHMAQLIREGRFDELDMTREEAEQLVKDLKLHRVQQQGELFHLIGELLGLFTSTGVAKSELPHIGSTWELLELVGDDMERIVQSKGGMARLLHDKRVKLYKLSPVRFFTHMGGAHS